MDKMLETIYKDYSVIMKSTGWTFDIDWNISWRTDWNGIVIMPDLTDKKFWIIWEAPGKEEVLCWLPFQWQAGKNLRQALWDKTKYAYITNSIKYRPYIKNVSDLGKVTFSNRPPTSTEIKVSSNFLLKEIEYLNNIWINDFLLVGNSSLKWLKCILSKLDETNIVYTLKKSDGKLLTLKQIIIADLLNQEITLTYEDKLINFFIIYHTSPLVWNFPKKRESIIEWINKFLKKIK